MRTFIVLCGLMFGCLSHAMDNLELETMINTQSEAIELLFTEKSTSDFFLNSVSVRTRLEMGVEVPWMAKLKVRPEVLLQWDR